MVMPRKVGMFLGATNFVINCVGGWLILASDQPLLWLVPFGTLLVISALIFWAHYGMGETIEEDT